MLYQLGLSIYRIENKAAKFAGWELVSASLNIGVTFYLVQSLTMGWQGRVYAQMGIFVLLAVLSVAILSRRSAVKWTLPSWPAFRSYLTLALPMVPHAISATIILSVDKFFIRYFEGDASLGIYSSAFQVGMVVMLFTEAFLRAWQPWFYKQMANGSRAALLKIVKFTWFYVVALGIGSVMYGLVAQLAFPYLVGPQYEAGASLILPVALCYFFTGCTRFCSPI